MRALAALIWKDLVIEARTRELVTSMSLVSFLALVILGLALGPSPRLAGGGTQAERWVAVVFFAPPPISPPPRASWRKMC